jgi:hypothetical protein
VTIGLAVAGTVTFATGTQHVLDDRVGAPAVLHDLVEIPVRP